MAQTAAKDLGLGKIAIVVGVGPGVLCAMEVKNSIIKSQIHCLAPIKQKVTSMVNAKA